VIQFLATVKIIVKTTLSVLCFVAAVGVNLKLIIDPTIPAADAQRMRIGVSVNRFTLSALLCVFNTHWSIGFIVLVQLNYAIAPEWVPVPALIKPEHQPETNCQLSLLSRRS
jgi:hypothetical protein